jgi:hypothetical protein
MGGRERKHPEIAGIRAESGDLGQSARTVPSAPWKSTQAFDFIQLWQVAEEFDVVGEGHGGSLFIAL